MSYSTSSARCWTIECHSFVLEGSHEHNNEGEHRGMIEVTWSLTLEHDLRNCRIRIDNDNICAVSYINKMGGRFAHLFSQQKEFLLMQHERGNDVLGNWIAGEDNVAADTRSRKADEKTDRSLARSYFIIFEEVWGPHSLDCFATAVNAQLARFYTFLPDFRALTAGKKLLRPRSCSDGEPLRISAVLPDTASSGDGAGERAHHDDGIAVLVKPHVVANVNDSASGHDDLLYFIPKGECFTLQFHWWNPQKAPNALVPTAIEPYHKEAHLCTPRVLYPAGFIAAGPSLMLRLIWRFR